MANTLSVAPNPRVTGIADPVADVRALTQVVKSLRQGVESLGGVRGPVLDRAVTFNDLVRLNLLTGTSPRDSVAVVVVPALFRALIFVPGTMIAGQVVWRGTFADIVLLPQGLAGSRATAAASATVSTVLTVRVAQGASAPNTFTTVGAVIFTASAVGVFTLAVARTMAPGDVLQLECIVADATLRDLSLTLVGEFG